MKIATQLQDDCYVKLFVLHHVKPGVLGPSTLVQVRGMMDQLGRDSFPDCQVLIRL